MTGNTALLAVALRVADHLCETFGARVAGLRRPFRHRDRVRGAVSRIGRSALPRAGRPVRREPGRTAVSRRPARFGLLPGSQADPGGTTGRRPRGARHLLGSRRRRRSRRNRRYAAVGIVVDPLARHGAEEALPHRRRWFAAQEGGVRRPVRTTGGSRLLRNVRRYRQHPLVVAAAARNGRIEIRGSDRAHHLQRTRCGNFHRWQVFLLLQPAASARRSRGLRRGGVGPSPRLVPVRLLPAEPHAGLRQLAALRRDHDRRRTPAASIHGRLSACRAGVR